MFEKCLSCGDRVFFTVKDQAGTFCSKRCRDYFFYPRFCQECIQSTADQSSGGTFTLNFIGTTFFLEKDRCLVCGSVVRWLVFSVLLVPLIPLGKYRVKYVSRDRFWSRKVLG